MLLAQVPWIIERSFGAEHQHDAISNMLNSCPLTGFLCMSKLRARVACREQLDSQAGSTIWTSTRREPMHAPCSPIYAPEDVI